MVFCPGCNMPVNSSLGVRSPAGLTYCQACGNSDAAATDFRACVCVELRTRAVLHQTKLSIKDLFREAQLPKTQETVDCLKAMIQKKKIAIFQGKVYGLR